MLIKQLSIFVENKSGRLAQVTKILGEANIDIRALVVSDTTDFGILRLIVNETDKAYSILKENGFTIKYTDVVVLGIPDEPGALSRVLLVLEDSNIQVEYMYAFLGRANGEAPAVFRFEDPENALKVLENANIKIITQNLL